MIEEDDQRPLEPVAVPLDQSSGGQPGELAGGHQHHQDEHQGQPFGELSFQPMDEAPKAVVTEQLLQIHGIAQGLNGEY
ncbi:MAG: hypothetical protein ACKOCM_08735 [Cyanobacteriota bacterium]